MKDFDRTWPAALHAVAGEVIELPWACERTPGSVLCWKCATVILWPTAPIALSFPPCWPWGPGGAPEPKPSRPMTMLPIGPLDAGDYSLCIRDAGGETNEITIRVTAGEPVQSWLVAPNRSLEIRNPAPVQIGNAEWAKDALVVHVWNANRFTRIHVAATRFLPERSLFELGSFERFEPGTGSPAKLPSLFAAGREIGDEYRYILERRYSKIFPGNMLTRPGLLLNPWEVRSTELQAQQLARMQPALATSGGRAGGGNGAVSRGKDAKAMVGLEPAESSGPNLDFLANAAPVIFNLVPDADGVVRLDRKALGDRQHVQIYAEDLTSAVWRSFALPEQPTKFKDLRLTRNLDPQKAFTEKKEATVLGAGKTLVLADILTSEMETYDSLASIYSLFTTLSGDAKLAKFAWVLQWPTLKDEEKRAKYSEFACHEMNFFLSKKDAPFFEKVVQPYLRNKKEKTFLDDYLLGADLTRYVEPWAFSRLNVAERCLLAKRLPAEAEAVARHLRERWELLPPNPEKLDALFETALHGRAMQGGDEGGFRNEKLKSEVKSLEKRDSSFAVGGTTGFPMDAPAPASPAHPAVARYDNQAGIAGGELASDKKMQLGSLESFKQLHEGLDTGESHENNNLNLRVSQRAGAKAKENWGRDFANEYQSNAMNGQLALADRALVRQFFRAPGPTKEWAENNYYLLPMAQQNAELITVNAFWRDFAEWKGEGTFVSVNVAEASRNFSEMMLALAVLDLPFEAQKHATKSADGAFTLTAAGPMIAFHKEIKPAAPAKENAELLVSQNFFKHGDRYREEGNEKSDKYVTGEFLAGVVYGANVVVTNPTSTPQKLSLLLQIPQGALPVLGSRATDSKRLQLAPYTTQMFEYFFYFPAPGAQPFPHYPMHVARNEQTAGAAKAVTFNVVRQLSEIDKTSWDYVSQYGTDEDVFEFLEGANIERLKIERIAWRARQSAEFFRKVVSVLAKRHIYSEAIYSYAIVHNDAPALREWLRHRDDFLKKCGPWLNAKLIAIDPIERRAYEQLEYSPLVNQRAHRVGAEHRIANPVFRGQYQSLLRILAHKPALDATDEMSVVYYLFLQDRVEEALARFHTIKPESLATRLQFDYFRCYAALYEEDLDGARTVANGYAKFPVDRWRKLFADVSTQLDEIAGASKPAVKVAADADPKRNREAQQGELAATEPSFDFKVENRTISLTWKNLREVTVNYYLMDPEFLFSASPFVSADPGRFAIIKSTKSAVQKLPEDKDALDVPLPAEFAKANVLVEILGAGERKAQAYHANSLKLALTENYGRLELRDEAASKPVAKAYVKVYARLKTGTIRFFKDGYTDLRGKFDYASLNSSGVHTMPEPRPIDARVSENLGYQMIKPEELNEVEKLAILIMSEGNGALVREAAPPHE